MAQANMTVEGINPFNFPGLMEKEAKDSPFVGMRTGIESMRGKESDNQNADTLIKQMQSSSIGKQAIAEKLKPKFGQEEVFIKQKDDPLFIPGAADRNPYSLASQKQEMEPLRVSRDPTNIKSILKNSVLLQEGL